MGRFRLVNVGVHITPFLLNSVEKGFNSIRKGSVLVDVTDIVNKRRYCSPLLEWTQESNRSEQIFSVERQHSKVGKLLSNAVFELECGYDAQGHLGRPPLIIVRSVTSAVILAACLATSIAEACPWPSTSTSVFVSP